MTLGFTLDDQGLGIKILQDGTGTVPQKGENIKVHYSGFLLDGTKFDSSVDRGRPIEFILGTGRVIKGWDQAFAQLKRGTKARILIPSELGYGPRGAGGGTIPPNATLIFEVELVE
ncbi:MAG: FKBP-type peptidyl-prolyl cis-trans isomerase [Cyclobacteriaceae bacterium]|nr:FKBP-type peptidyl-prolyl cis-trans isomerase [Cyclobacteriaceae bacterium SS2]